MKTTREGENIKGWGTIVFVIKAIVSNHLIKHFDFLSCHPHQQLQNVKLDCRMFQFVFLHEYIREIIFNSVHPIIRNVRRLRALVNVENGLNYHNITALFAIIITGREGKGLAKVEEEEEVGETWDSKLTFILATVGWVFCLILFFIIG